MLTISPSTELYTLGRGILSIGPWVGSTPPLTAAYVDVGVCNKLELEVTEEKLEHFSRRLAARAKDKIAVLESGYNISFTLDEVSILNLKMLLRAQQSGDGILHANEGSITEYAVRFVSDNAEGPNATWRFWRVRLGPAGPFGLIADDWQALAFAGEGLADTANHPTSPFFDVLFTGATSTTTSTTWSTTSTAP